MNIRLNIENALGCVTRNQIENMLLKEQPLLKPLRKAQVQATISSDG